MLKISLLMGALVALAGCGGGAAPTLACVPGDQKACACLGDGRGIQICKDDGSGYHACLGCVAANDLGPPSPAGHTRKRLLILGVAACGPGRGYGEARSRVR